MTAVEVTAARPSAVLDETHVGDIRGAFGTIRVDDFEARRTLSAKMKTLLAVVGPGLIVMVGDNDAGAFSTYGQAGQNYGTRLLWTLLLLIPLYMMSHPAGASMVRGFTTPDLPGGSGGMAVVMLLVIGIVGTTVAPWQLFFQQSYVVDKRITPRFMKYEKADLWIGIVIVVLGATAVMGATAAAFAGTKGAGNFTDSAGLARGVAAYGGHLAGAVFAVALLDAAIIGAFAVSLSSAYAIGDVLGMNHSLHRGVGQAKGFYAIYVALICGAATVVLIPGSPLGLITEGVQVLAGVLLPSATVFLLLLCNDKAVLGPWVNGRRTNAFTAAVISVLITLSVILTVSVVFPHITAGQILMIIAGCAAAAVAAGGALMARGTSGGAADEGVASYGDRMMWRMPPLSELPAPVITGARKVGLIGLRGYLAMAMILVVVKVVLMAIGH